MNEIESVLNEINELSKGINLNDFYSIRIDKDFNNFYKVCVQGEYNSETVMNILRHITAFDEVTVNSIGNIVATHGCVEFIFT